MYAYLTASLYTRCHSMKADRLFAHCHSQKPVRFPAEQNECVHHATPSFCPSAVAAGITHYTLQARWCGLPTAFSRLSALKGNNQRRKLMHSLFCCVVALDGGRAALQAMPVVSSMSAIDLLLLVLIGF